MVRWTLRSRSRLGWRLLGIAWLHFRLMLRCLKARLERWRYEVMIPSCVALDLVSI